jgi:hypothetical protein
MIADMDSRTVISEESARRMKREVNLLRESMSTFVQDMHSLIDEMEHTQSNSPAVESKR